MKKSTIWGVALSAVLCTGAAVAAVYAPAVQKVAEAQTLSYTLTPEAGVVTNLTTITVNFPTQPGVEFKENFTNSIVLTNTTTGTDYLVAGVIPDMRSMNGGSTLNITFVRDGEEDVLPVVEPGEYTLNVKDGAFVYTENEVETSISGFTANYSIKGIAAEFDPATGSVVTDLSTVTLTFPNNRGVEFVENFTNSIVLVNTTTNDEYVLAGDPTRVTNTAVGLKGTSYELSFSTEEGGNVVAISQPGYYELRIKEGAFSYSEVEGGEAMKVQALTALYSINGVNYTLTPAVGEVDDLSMIELNIAEIGVVYKENFQNSIVLTNRTTGDEYVLAGDPDRLTKTQQGGTTFQMRFALVGEEDAATIVAPGNYELAIKEGAFIVEDEEGNEMSKIQQINAAYTINGISYVTDPAAGTTVSDLSVITLQFPDVKGVEYMENAPANAVVLQNTTSGKEYVLLGGEPDMLTKTMLGGSAFELRFGAAEGEAASVTEPGNYVLRVKKGAFVYGEGEEKAQVQALNVNFTIGGIQYTFDPADGSIVDDLQVVTINFPTTVGVEYFENAPVNSILLVNTNTNTEYVLAGEPDFIAKSMNPGTTFEMHFIADDAENVSPITNPGNYELRIKEGTFVYGVDKEKVQAIKAKYQIEGISFNLNPASGGVVENLETIEVNFPDAAGIEVAENVINGAVLTNTTTGVEYVLAAEPDLVPKSMNPGTTYQMHFMVAGAEQTSAITTPGEYTLQVRKGLFTYGEDKTPVQALNANYTIEGVAFVLDPENGSVVEDLSVVTVNFLQEGVEFTENLVNSIMLVNTTNNTEYVLAGDPDFIAKSMNPGTTYEMHFLAVGAEEVSPITVPGQYELMIKKGAFNYGEEKTPVQPIFASYTIEGVTYVLTPADGDVVADLTKITINFPENKGVEFTENFQNSIMLTNETTNVVYLLAGDPDFVAKSENPGTTFEMVFVAEGEDDVTAVNEPGTYRLQIKEGAFTLNGEKVEAIEAVYVCDGSKVSEVLGDAETFVVYNAAGVKVLDNASAQDVNALESGLYVINGKKVLVRK